MKKRYLITVLLLIPLTACQQETLQFTDIPVQEEANMWWARIPADLTGNGLTDLALQDNNAYGGRLGYLEAIDRYIWETKIIAETAPGGETFSAGDLDAADIDGDGDIDIAPNGYWIENPGDDMTGNWKIHSINEKWHNQEGDWSKNATNVFCRDINNDGKAEVFISHSERSGYPLAYYQSDDPASGNWTEFLLSEGGIYNGQCADIEGDGDIDIFRLPTHDDTHFEILANLIK